MGSLNERIKIKIWNNIKDIFFDQLIADPPFILNINYDSSLIQKRIAICYKTPGFFKNFLDPEETIERTYYAEVFQIVLYFIKLGYALDIVDCVNIKTVNRLKNRNYFLLFGFGETFYSLTNEYPEAISILYMTENHPEITYRNEQERVNYYYQRHGKKARVARSGLFYKKYHLEKTYSHVITVSDTEPFSKQYENIHSIFLTGLINKNYSQGPKYHWKARRHFLWLGSMGAIHKGLDILIDIFREQEDLVLHICGLLDFEKKFLGLRECKGIVDQGQIDIQSSGFLDLVNTCSFIILPSCSEGCSTSVTTGMLHGLIPVVMNNNTGFNRFAGKVIYLNDFKVEYIRSRINEISLTDPAKLEKMSDEVYQFALENFTIKAFENKFSAIMNSILNLK
jgi:glycosyltransferase involved in cell wall biosynthesis